MLVPLRSLRSLGRARFARRAPCHHSLPVVTSLALPLSCPLAASRVEMSPPREIDRHITSRVKPCARGRGRSICSRGIGRSPGRLIPTGASVRNDWGLSGLQPNGCETVDARQDQRTDATMTPPHDGYRSRDSRQSAAKDRADHDASSNRFVVPSDVPFGRRSTISLGRAVTPTLPVRTLRRRLVRCFAHLITSFLNLT